MGTESQASVPSARRRSVMLFRRARTALVLVGVFWLWLLLGSAGFVASLFDRPFYAMLAMYGVGTLTLISLLIAPVALAYLLMNRPANTSRQPAAAEQPHKSVRSELAPVIRMIPRKVKDSSASLGTKAAAKWRDLAS